MPKITARIHYAPDGWADRLMKQIAPAAYAAYDGKKGRLFAPRTENNPI